ncbi:vesicle coat complex subunit zeta [Tubulinosema ratisbonensis]|uniref:Coatomer subunit zeta n=1 Tax=Tubulinosema ratisbonensis TaxID=291195 RepID=A0A437AND1_9MICR|nr:vesicle coat complex subunit zeta [Tubulinosema ratisbonensis]
MKTDIMDVECLAIVDESGEILLQTNYPRKTSQIICKKALKDLSEISVIDEKVVLTKRLDEIYVIIFSPEDRNEVLLAHYLEIFTEALFKIMRKTTREYVFKKYDQICLLLSNFIYNNIVLVEDVNLLVSKVPIRSFEGLESMYIPQSFATFFNKAKKTINKRNK